MSEKYCPKCGARGEPDDVFCIQCGTKLETKESAERGTGKSVPGKTPAKQPENHSQSKTPAVIVTLIILGLIYSLFTGAWAPEQVFHDDASAAASLKAQILKHEKSLKLTYNLPEKAYFFDTTANKLVKQAIAYNGDPAEGDRLGLLCRNNGAGGHCTENRDGTFDAHISIPMVYYLTPEQEKEFQASAQKVLKELRLEGKSAYEKIRSIYNYICSHVTYDYAHLEDENYVLQYTGYAALKYHTAVCSGVADLFYYLANAAGVETRIQTHSTHAWNFVKIDGKCYYLDATWDLGLPESAYQFFMKGTVDFDAHYGGLKISPWGAGNLLTDTYKGYEFSHFAWGDERNKLPI